MVKFRLIVLVFKFPLTGYRGLGVPITTASGI